MNTAVAALVGGESGPLGDWTPESLGSDIDYWYDVFDETYISKIVSTINTLFDRSPSGYDANETLSSKPDVVSWQGNSGIAFAGAHDIAKTVGGNTYMDTILSGQSFMQFAIGEITSSSLGAFIGQNHGSQYGRPPLETLSGDKVGCQYINGPTLTVPTSTPVMLMAYGTMGGANYSATLVRDGDTAGQSSGSSIGFGHANAQAPNIILGSRSSSSDSVSKGNLIIGEVFSAKTNFDEATRDKIFGYAAHKWGLTANLPVSHPYKTTAPQL